MIDLGSYAQRYEVVRTVSTGPRATVFQAIDRFHDRPVALKVHAVDDGDRERFLSEANILMSIRPHAALPVVCNDFITDDSRHYVLVVNWIDGSSLQDRLDDEGALPLDEVVEIAEHVAGALDHLHAHEPPVVHGDVKPANIVRTATGSVCLVDFDIASVHGSRGRVGTVGYVAPEVAAGDKPLPASDVYGLAATVVALLTGGPPAPSEPALTGLDLPTQSRVSKALAQALAADPSKRPASAARFVVGLRGASHAEYPTGVVALLATKVVGSSRLWARDPEEMQVALRRLRSVRDEVVGELDGHLVTSVNEADRTLLVFNSAASAARAALLLHERLASTAMPSGFELQLRAGVAVGEAVLAGGAYTGSVVDLVLQLRSIAGPGTTLTTEATAELLLPLVGREASVVSLAGSPGLELPDDILLRAITRPGAESLATLREPPSISGPVLAGPPPARSTTPVLPPPAPVPAETAPMIAPEQCHDEPSIHGSSSRSVAAAVVENPVVLVGMVVCGLAIIYLVVLASEVGRTTSAQIMLLIGAGASIGAAVRVASSVIHEQRAEAERIGRDQAARERFEREEHDRTALRGRLAEGFDRLGTDDARRGVRVLDDLVAEFDVARRAVDHGDVATHSGAALVVPELIDETYRHGISALSDALELLETSDGPRLRRLGSELVEIDSRLGADEHDAAERARDELRAASHRELIDRATRTRERGRDLIFEAERCTAAISRARLDLAGIRVDDTQVVVDAVVDRMEDTIRRVRRIQEEVRRLEW